MPLRLEIKKKLSARSERVKCVDFHPNEPWILASLYSGHVFIWNYVTQSMVKSIEVCDLPVRCAKFIPQKQWIICGSDDMQLRVYNYNTMERIKTFEAHTDYIRSLAIHPTLPYILSSSDDMLIKLWDYEKNFECMQIFEGHTHYVMQIEFNPKDTNTFASASLDRTVKIWGLNSPNPHFSLEGHERGVNCLGYFRGGDKPYLVSGADDHTIRVWDYQTKVCISILEGHTNNISSVGFHPSLPIILSGSEDGTVRIWHSNTYRLENTLNYGMERVWTINCLKGSNKVAIGYDDGTIMIKIGHEEPVVSMERGGKVCWAINHQVVSANVKVTGSEVPADGDRLQLVAKDLGDPSELYPQSISHSPNGRLITICGDGKYDICTALTLKQKSHGDALEFVWAEEAGMYATRESSSKVRVFKDFKDHKPVRLGFASEGIFGGPLLAVRSADFVDFMDWEECKVIRRIDVVPRKIFWSESGELVVLACDTSFFVLRYNKELVAKFAGSDIEITEQGIEGSFDLEEEVGEKIRNGYFIGDCFIYTNTSGRLNYYVGGEIITLAHLNKPMYLLGYLPKENRVYLMDKSHNIYSYALLLSTLIYQTSIVRRDFDGARKVLSSIPITEHTKIARFLEGQDLKELALQVTQDQEHKFELAMACKKLAFAKQILLDDPSQASENKWKLLGDAALAPVDPKEFNIDLAKESYEKAGDLGGLLLIYSSLADAIGMERLATLAEQQGRANIAFLCYFLLRRIPDAIRILTDTDRIPEAAFMTRTYAPMDITRVLGLWKENLAKVSVKAAEALADPVDYEELFPDLAVARDVERYVRVNETELLPSILYGDYSTAILRNLIQEMKDGGLERVSQEEYAKVAPSLGARPAASVQQEEKESPRQAPPAAASSSVSASSFAAVSPVAASPVASFSPKPVTPAAAAAPVTPASAAVATTPAASPFGGASSFAAASPVAASPAASSFPSASFPASTPTKPVTPIAAVASPIVAASPVQAVPSSSFPSASFPASSPVQQKPTTPSAAASSLASPARAAPVAAAPIAQSADEEDEPEEEEEEDDFLASITSSKPTTTSATSTSKPISSGLADIDSILADAGIEDDDDFGDIE